MRRIILFVASSLDGFIARKDGGLDWLFSDGDYGFSRFFASVDTVVMGRKTWQVAQALGDSFQGKKVYVFSRRKKGMTFSAQPAPLCRKLRKGHGKDIWLVGGGEIAAKLLDAKLVDRIILSVHPVILGEGIPLTKRLGSDVPLRLLSTRRFPSGLVQLTYKVR